MGATIVTGELIKQYLQLGDTDGGQDVLLDRLGLATESLLSKWLGRSLGSTTYTNDRYDGNGRDTLYLRDGPISALASVSIGGSAVTSGDGSTWPLPQIVYFSDYLRRADGLGFPLGFSNVLVTYTAGFGTVPSAVVQAGVQWAAQLFGSGRRGLTADNGLDLAEMPETVKAALWPYRRVAF